MLTPERLLRLMIELIFIMLGGLIAWLALVRHIAVDRHGVSWLILSVALILLGKLDARSFSFASGNSDAGDFARALLVGRANAGGRGWIARAARPHWLRAGAPATLVRGSRKLITLIVLSLRRLVQL